MSAATIIMVVFICVGSALGIAGLAFVGYWALKLRNTAHAAGISSRAQLQQVMGRAARLGPRVSALQIKQKAVADKLSGLSATARRFR